ncbi:hypothetical protein ABT061_17805 [Streptosporangium sp. NPDC002544]|uniref:hypothetical protein n=1 Tax=Streptosporangium sp. NPDC002544 TaxID=3154538 RepID=UPI0033312A4B
MWQGKEADAKAEELVTGLRNSESIRLAALADATRLTDPRLGLLLSVAAWRLAGTTQARTALNGALVQREQAMFRDSGGGAGVLTYFAADGRTLVSLRGGLARLLDVRSGRQVAAVTGLDHCLGRLRLTSSPERLRRLKPRAGISSGDLSSEPRQPLGPQRIPRPWWHRCLLPGGADEFFGGVTEHGDPLWTIKGSSAGGTSARPSVVRVADPVVPQTVTTTFPGACPSSTYPMAAGISSNG